MLTSFKKIMVSALFVSFLFLLTSPVCYADDIIYYKIVDCSEIFSLLEKSSYSDDLVKKVADYCNANSVYYSVSAYADSDSSGNCISIFYGMKDSKPTFYAYSFKYKSDNSFYTSQRYEISDNTFIVDNGNFSKLSDIVSSFSFTEQQLKDKYKIDSVTNVTYNTNNNYSSDNNVNNNILDSVKMNNSLLLWVIIVSVFGVIIYIFYKIIDFFIE